MKKDSRVKSATSPALVNRRDILIIGALVLVLGLWMLWSYVIAPRLDSNSELSYAWIYHDNDLIEKFALDGTVRQWDVEVPGHPEIRMTIETTADRRIMVTEANCPDKVCINTGKVYMDGQSIACLPNHVIIKIGTEHSSGGAGLDG